MSFFYYYSFISFFFSLPLWMKAASMLGFMWIFYLLFKLILIKPICFPPFTKILITGCCEGLGNEIVQNLSAQKNKYEFFLLDKNLEVGIALGKHKLKFSI